MDDLTTLKGIGKSGAKALTEASLGTFAAIAAADPDKRPEGLSASVDWADIIAQAKDLTSTNTQKGQSGTAREAPSTGGGTAAKETSPVVGTQSAAPHFSPTEELSGEFILVTGPKRGRWRAGRHFTQEPVLFDLAKLTEEEGAAILGDKALTVEILTADDVIAMQHEAE